jgi:hypothetical protein
MKTAFSLESAPRLYIEDPGPADIIIKKALKMAVEDDSEEIGRKELRSEKKTLCLLQLQ